MTLEAKCTSCNDHEVPEQYFTEYTQLPKLNWDPPPFLGIHPSFLGSTPISFFKKSETLKMYHYNPMTVFMILPGICTKKCQSWPKKLLFFLQMK